MRIYIDESGNFSWSPPKPSVFVSLIVLDREESGIFCRFRAWKQKKGVSLKAEVKGADQSDEELVGFVTSVFAEKTGNPRLIVVGVDTAVTMEETVLAVKAQVAEQFAHGVRVVERVNPANRALIQSYREMPGWIRRRSSANVLWISALEELLRQTLQLAVITYSDERFDEEFSDIQINIDRSFIKEYRHETFWKAWLGNGFTNRRHRSAAFLRPREWRERQHPFIQKFSQGMYLNFTPLYSKVLSFVIPRSARGCRLPTFALRLSPDI